MDHDGGELAPYYAQWVAKQLLPDCVEPAVAFLTETLPSLRAPHERGTADRDSSE